MPRRQPPKPRETIRQWLERLLASTEKGKEREAQDLVYDSWDTADDDKAYDLLEQAVDLDPTNVDAWLGLMDFEGMGDGERLDLLRRLVALGKENLGEKTFQECRGHFWEVFETRPYMRARRRLAHQLMQMEKFEGSIAEYEGMLELAPGDNQGARYELMACYLAGARLDDARRLFDRYDERERTTFFAWAYVLERFLSGDLAGAAAGLRTARRLNSHALAYFLGERRLPKARPDSYSGGSKEEAVIAWSIMRPAWEKHPSAREWLRAQKGGAKAR